MASNANKSKGIVAIAVEDEAVMVMHVVMGANGQTIDIAPPLSIPRLAFDPQNPLEDIKQFYLDDLMDVICSVILRCLEEGMPVDALAVSTFGNVDNSHATIRHVANRGKFKGKFRNFPIRKYLADKVPSHKDIPIDLYNDATAVAYGEYVQGHGKPGDRAFSSIILGRGVNAGIIVNGRPFGGHLHPEMAHYLPRIHEADREYFDRISSDQENPKCAIHLNCQLALTSARALFDRQQLVESKKLSAELLIGIYAYYIAQLCTALTLTVSPSRISIGGSIFRSDDFRKILPQQKTMAAIRSAFTDQIGRYPEYRQTKFVDGYIIGSKLGDNAALIGLFQSARDKIISGEWQ